MAYRNGIVIEATKRLLDERPWRSLEEVSRALGISRATVGRELRAAGITFREARAKAVAEKLARLRVRPVPRAAKELAAELGFPSASAFAHYLGARRNRASQNDP